jgi:hypothetical protein
MPILSRDAILTADDLAFEEVEVPEWGGSVRIRCLTGTERDNFEASVYKNGETPDFRNVRAKLVAKTIVDEEGNRLFTDNDVKELGRKSAGALNRVWEASSRLSGLSEDDIKELAGNSSAALTDDDTSV